VGGSWSEFSSRLRESIPGNGGRLGLYLVMEEITPQLNYTGIFRLDAQSRLLAEGGKRSLA
jgi:hypothetical protein